MDRGEINDILISVLAISLAFTIARSEPIAALTGASTFTLGDFGLLFVVSLFTVGIGFVLHELAHKYMAIRYGSWAAYRAWPMGLQLALLTSLFGIVFAAPGATYIYNPYMSKRESGIVSVIGPLTNIALAFVFLLASPILLVLLPGMVGLMLVGQGIAINLWLAFFNMLPFGPLDGKKVMDWNVAVWALIIGGTFALLFL
ncbi:Uncharacterised protein [Candidatus Burarchaeum australiense]|nr:Uncharacterised protein [Candidatus Burarchaeum australiense]